MGRKARTGSGKNFKALKNKLARRRGKNKVSSPSGLAAYIGRKKLGKAKFQKLAAQGRRRAAAKRRGKRG